MIESIPQIPVFQQKYLNVVPPAGLVVLQNPNRILPPAASDGPGIPSDKILEHSLYDEHGRLPLINGPGQTFLAKI
jgi:hypothetical protein